MYLTHLLLVTKDETITESHCVGLNMCYIDQCSKILYEHAGTKEKFKFWLDDLKSKHRQKLNNIIKHNERAEIVYHACTEIKEGSMSFAEKVIAKGIKKISELQQFNVGRSLLHGIIFDLDKQCWSSFLYESGSTTVSMYSLDIPHATQQALF